jgi:hypothetical protein
MMIAPMAELNRHCGFALGATPRPMEATRLVPKPVASSATDGGARKWRRNCLKRLNPRPELVWSRKPRSHYIWYTGARPTVRSDLQKVGRLGSSEETSHCCKGGKFSCLQSLDKARYRERISAARRPTSLGRCPKNCYVNSTVIASAAKQSRGHSTRPLDCFVARAPRNDGQWRCSRSPSRLSCFGASTNLSPRFVPESAASPSTDATLRK